MLTGKAYPYFSPPRPKTKKKVLKMNSVSPQNIPVNHKFYEALDAMLDNYQANEGIDAYKHFGTLLGYSGSNRAAIIYQKLNPNQTEARLYADELVLMVERLGVYSAPVSHFFMSFCSNALEPNRLTLSQSASAFSKIFGSLNLQLIESLSDGSISERERAALVPFIDDAMSKLQIMRSALTLTTQQNTTEKESLNA